MVNGLTQGVHPRTKWPHSGWGIHKVALGLGEPQIGQVR